MRDAAWWKLGTTCAVACAAAGVAVFAVKIWLEKLQRRRSTRLHIRRLASEIVAIADTIDSDLAHFPRDSHTAQLRLRCGESRGRAAQALSPAAALSRPDPDALHRELELLHDDHRRMVNLRSDVDADAAALRDGRRLYAVRSSHSSLQRSTPQRWRRSSGGMRTIPSTLSPSTLMGL